MQPNLGHSSLYLQSRGSTIESDAESLSNIGKSSRRLWNCGALNSRGLCSGQGLIIPGTTASGGTTASSNKHKQERAWYSFPALEPSVPSRGKPTLLSSTRSSLVHHWSPRPSALNDRSEGRGTVPPCSSQEDSWSEPELEPCTQPKSHHQYLPYVLQDLGVGPPAGTWPGGQWPMQ